MLEILCSNCKLHKWLISLRMYYKMFPLALKAVCIILFRSQFKLSDYIGPEPQGSGNHGPFRIPPPPRDMREPRGLPRHRFGAPPRDPYEQPRDPYGDGSDRFGSSRHYTAHRGHYTRDPPVGPSDPFRTSAYYEDPRYESGRLSG